MIEAAYHTAVRKIVHLPRVWKRAILIAYDVTALLVALWLSFALRLGGWLPWLNLQQALAVAAAPIVAIPIFVRMGLYRAVVRYLPERALWTIVQAMTLAVVCWVVVIFLAQYAGGAIVPRSVPVFYWALGSLLVAGSRFAAKRVFWPDERAERAKKPTVVIYGAGEAGAQLANSLRRTHSLVGFIDDNVSLQGRDVAGLRVFPPTEMARLADRYGVREVILSIPSLPTARRRDIVEAVSGLGLKLRALPPIGDLATGKYLVSQIREIDIDELLGRSSVPPNPELIGSMLAGRSILVTGAGGSIGAELCRLIVRWKPTKLVLFEANEFALYTIDRELRESTDIAIVPVLGSITDEARVRQAIVGNGVTVLFHAAAHKHVPLLEGNALEGMRNNIVGTRIVTKVAMANGVENFVLISSDKAVRPTNVMGATKRWAELLVFEKAALARERQTGQRFSVVRFGNVLGSNGSVVPLFREQIARGGPVTLTDPRMTRYFMSIHEAAELIVQAGALSRGGDLFLLDMGEPVKIATLAESMIRLAGLSVRDERNPEGDIAIEVTGIRPGEKLFEELLYDEAQVGRTVHPKIVSAATGEAGELGILLALARLEAALGDQNEAAARQILFKTIGAEGYSTSTSRETSTQIS